MEFRDYDVHQLSEEPLRKFPVPLCGIRSRRWRTVKQEKKLLGMDHGGDVYCTMVPLSTRMPR